MLATAGAAVSAMRVWVDGVERGGGGCVTAAGCARGLSVGLTDGAVARGKHSVVVRVNATASGGMTRRLFFVGR